MSATLIQPPRYDAWAFAQLLVGRDDGVDHALISEANRPLAEGLASLRLEDRKGKWDSYVEALPDGEKWVLEVGAIDPHTVAPNPDQVEEGWGPLRLGALPAATPFPVEVFPEPVRRMVLEGAEAIGCPPDFLGLPVLAVAGGAIGRSVQAQVKEGYPATACVYAALIARPGEAKTPALSAVAKPMWGIDGNLHDEWRLLMDQYNELMDAYEAAPKAGKPSKPVPPVLGRAVVDNSTVEALIPILADNPRGLLMVKDELTALVSGMNQYKAGGKGSDRQEYLKIWSGSPISHDRKSNQDREAIRVPEPFLSIVGNLTPAMLGSLAEGKGRDDGFEDRFLFAYPEPMPKRPLSDVGLSEAASRGWEEVILGLRCRAMMEKDGRARPQVISFEPEARTALFAWFRARADEVNALGFPDSLRGPWSKLEAYFPRLALILHLLDLASDPVRSDSDPIPDVSPRAVRGAARLIEYFENNVRRVRALMGGRRGPVGGDDVQSILQWLRRNGIEHFSERELKQAIRRFSQDEAGLADALEFLLRQGVILKEERSPSPGKKGRSPSPVYRVHPALVGSRNTQNAHITEDAMSFDGSENSEAPVKESNRGEACDDDIPF